MTQENITINIKPNELMLGDYIAIKCADRSTINIKVSSIGELMIAGTMVNNPNASSWRHYNDLQPIPLTSEVLEKNAHRVPGYLVWDLEADGAEVQYVPETMDTTDPPMQYRLAPRQRNLGVAETLICHIRYVHELQHALRICKINKEIVL